MIGTTLSHYRVVERIGAGGMGLVFRAHDERLERDVALKVLPAEAIGSDTERRRFRREALMLSKLNHPGIAVVHDFDRDGDTDFLVMELVPGETLRDAIARGPLEQATVVDAGIQIAAALDAAHAQGVLHRDLKPGNIMVTPSGLVKVLDFGLAKVGGASSPDSAVDTASQGTVTGALAGTLAYMAPEQLLGKPADHRSDLHAFGVVLYEMATGRLPWRETLSTAQVLEIVNRVPDPPSRLRTGLSPRVDDLVMKLLEKDPGLRYQSAREAGVDLKRIAASAARGPHPATGEGGPIAGAGRDGAIRSIAVLPLANLSGDPEQEFFADGMTEALISDLAQIGALRVISRTSVMQFKGARKSLPEIATALKVDAVVEGSVLRAGNRVRISAQLVEAATDRHLWARSYDGKLDDVLGLQCDVAKAIANEIRVKVTPGEASRFETARTVNPAALEAYLRGRYLWNKRTRSDVQASVEHFQRAIDVDPSYALAHAGLSDAFHILADLDAIPYGEAFAKARTAAERALALDPSLGEARAALATVMFRHDYDWDGSLREYAEALRLRPGYASGHQWHSLTLSALGRHDEAIAEARRAEELDPLSLVIGTTVSDTLYFARRYEESVHQLRKVIDMGTFFGAHSDLGRSLIELGEYDEAAEQFRTAARIVGAEPERSGGLAYALAAGGRLDEARAILAGIEERRALGVMSSFTLCGLYLVLGDRERAMALLEEAYRTRDRALVWVKVHPRLDPLRDHPRFLELLKRLKLDR